MTVKLLAFSDIVVRRSELRKATSVAAKAAPKNAACTLASKLLPRLFSWQELAMSRGQGISTKKAGDIRPPLHHARIEVLKDYVIAWCTKNGKDVKEQDINDAIIEQVSYARKKMKSQ
ncbi:hypothetical protein ACJMK2_024995 [Sinanodonta woodiana]|uniref:Uncharacterized protein n=1 Tax=Sinanodonta woodiana TaxID=1069815 RepID=A0ABD3XH16_SINWO